MVYPVAYRAAAAVYSPGFQLGNIPPAPLPVVAFLSAFVAAWKALDYFDPQGANVLRENYPFLYDALDPRLSEEDITGEKIIQRKVESSPLPDANGGEPVVIPAMFGFTLTLNCEPCAGQAGWDNGLKKASGTNVACCAGTSANSLNNFPVGPATNKAYVYKQNTARIGQTNEYSKRYEYTRNPGYNGVPSPYPVALPLSPDVPVDVGNDVNNPVFPTAWSLPIRNPGVVKNPPWPFPIPGVSIPAPIAPGVGAGAGVGAGVGTVPIPLPIVLIPVLGGGALAASPASPLPVNPKPPGPNKREIKMKGKGAKAFKYMVNEVTEFRDFVQALWKALPQELRSKCKGPRGGRAKCTLQDMIKDLARNAKYLWNNEQWAKEALKQVIVNEIQDTFYGHAGQRYTQAANALRSKGLWGDVAGFQTGNAYRPRAEVKGEPDRLYNIVSAVVDAVW